MTITIQSVEDEMSYFVPYYFNMSCGQFVTQVVTPAVGCETYGENGDVYDCFYLLDTNAQVFTAQHKDKYLSEVLQEGAVVRHKKAGNAVENGSRAAPTKYQLTLRPNIVPTKSSKKRKLSIE